MEAQPLRLRLLSTTIASMDNDRKKMQSQMKKTLFLLFSLFLGSTIYAQNDIPMLKTVNGRQQLCVDGQPWLMLAGELHNSSTGSSHYMQPIWQRLASKHLNTVLAVVSWELTEPEEGHYDFTLVDEIVRGANDAQLKVVLLWFGSWKNGASTYVPAWVKTNQKRFPLACFSDGKKMNTLSTLGTATCEADARAFAAMMRHLRENDKEHTVIMVQVENEIGTLDSSSAFAGMENRSMRDYSPLANKAFASAVPAQLTKYLSSHLKSLHPAIRHAWETNGKKMKGTWEEVFGKGQPRSGTDDWQNEYPYLTEEIFMAWHYATYVERVAAEGKREYPLPMYVNAWLKQDSGREPGVYPSGGPLPHVFDIWRAAAPHIDFFAPDIYAIDSFDWVCETFKTQGNPLFIPETTSDVAGAARCFYALGKYGVIGYSPFGIDGNGLMMSADQEDRSYDKAYATLGQLTPYIQKYAGTNHIAGLLINDQNPYDSITLGDYTLSIAPFSAERAMAVAGVVVKDDPTKPHGGTAGLLIIVEAPGEFLVSGMGDMMIAIEKSECCKASDVALLSVDEVTFDALGRMRLHRLNGDETALGGAVIKQGEVKTYRIKMYQI